ncbi:unnamed protein product [Meloidogyne enterolobii]|uniref:Uncharacterized protein n=1 Tax=Meloidogyne enterolobii TaxID=390850 RepID=A0ACB1B4Y9_MELEN
MLKLSKLNLHHFLFVLLSLAIEFRSASSMLNWWNGNDDPHYSSTIHPEEPAGQVQHIPNVHHLLAPPSTPIGSVAATPVHGSPVRNFDQSYYGTTSNQFGNRTFTPNDVY